MIRWPLLAAALLSGCASSGGSSLLCDRAGCTPLRVFLVSAAPAPSVAVVAPGKTKGCAVYTDLPPSTKEPDAYGPALRHIGESVYRCLTGVAAVVADDPPTSFYHEQLWFKIDGNCHALDHPGYTAYGCFDYSCRSINTNLGHIGPPAVCPSGTPMAQWTDACWTQFYTVLGHEVTHGWLGNFHQ
jgi:hypothetical protein